MLKEFWLQRWKGSDHLEDPGVDRQLEVQRMLREVGQPVSVRTPIILSFDIQRTVHRDIFL
jgi:hypothetical protein